jgi:hypothetical protein
VQSCRLCPVSLWGLQYEAQLNGCLLERCLKSKCSQYLLL